MNIGRALSSAAQALGPIRERRRARKAEASAAQQAEEDRRLAMEDRQRRISLEDVLRKRQDEEYNYRLSQRPLEEELNRIKLDQMRNPRPAPAQRTYDANRGVVVDEMEGRAIPVQGLPPAQQRPVSEAQIAANEQRRFQRTQALQQDYRNNASVKNGYELARVAGGLRAALAGESPMDDLSIVYETVKMFDPTSVVREGEIRLMNNAQSVPLQLRLMVEKWNTGRLLTPGMRAHIAALLDRKVSESQKAVQPIQAEYGAQARRYGVEADSSFIAPSPFVGVKSSKRSRLPNQE